MSALAACALLALAGCGGGTHAPATAARPAPPPDPHAALSLEAAEQVLRAHNFGGLSFSGRPFRPHQPLKVLVGGRPEAADVPGQQAFFFFGDRFVGTDTPDVSAEIAIVHQTSDRITLSYVLYKPNDGMSVPNGGRTQVTYRWDGTRVVPEGPIPTSVWGAPLSRR